MNRGIRALLIAGLCTFAVAAMAATATAQTAAVSPGKFGIAVTSPSLDAAGNSVKAQRAIADVSNGLGGNPYAPKARK